MAIEIRHDTPSLYAGFGEIIGAAKAEEKRAEQLAEISSRLMATKLEHKNRMAMAEFEAGLDLQKEQRAKQWELEKATMRSQHDFSLAEQERDLQAKYEMGKRLELQQKIDVGMSAIDDAVRDGVINSNQGKVAKIQLRYGINIGKGQEGFMGDLLGTEQPVAGKSATTYLTNEEGQPFTIEGGKSVSLSQKFANQAPIVKKKTEYSPTPMIYGGMGMPSSKVVEKEIVTKQDWGMISKLSSEDMIAFDRIVKSGDMEKIEKAVQLLRAKFNP